MELISELNIESYDQKEILIVIQDFFSVGKQTNKYEISFYLSQRDLDQNKHALKLIFSNRKRKLHSVIASPSFPKDSIKRLKQKIKSELVQNNNTKVGNKILYSSVPIKEGYQIDNLFFFRPLPEDEHKTKHHMGLHPFLLKFKFYDSPNTFISMYRSQSKARELQLLLNIFLNISVRSKNSTTGIHHWIEEDESDWGEQPIQSIIKKVDPSRYYHENFVSYLEGVPSNFDSLFVKFYSLEKSLQLQFLTAAYWLQHSAEVSPISKSAVYLALINAIETLARNEENTSECPTCKKKEGATRQFREFVKRFVPGVRQPYINKLYDVRSQLTHGYCIFENDEQEFLNFTPFSIEEILKLNETSYITKLSLINWLLSQKTDTTD